MLMRCRLSLVRMPVRLADQNSSRGMSFSPSTMTSSLVAEIPPRSTRESSRLGADVQAGDGLLEQLERNSGVEQSAEEHVAADAGETIEIGNAHGSAESAADSSS